MTASDGEVRTNIEDSHNRTRDALLLTLFDLLLGSTLYICSVHTPF
jgi:hypothetical protein